MEKRHSVFFSKARAKKKFVAGDFYAKNLSGSGSYGGWQVPTMLHPNEQPSGRK